MIHLLSSHSSILPFNGSIRSSNWRGEISWTAQRSGKEAVPCAPSLFSYLHGLICAEHESARKRPRGLFSAVGFLRFVPSDLLLDIYLTLGTKKRKRPDFFDDDEEDSPSKSKKSKLVVPDSPAAISFKSQKIKVSLLILSS